MSRALTLQPRPPVAPPARWRFPAPRRHRLGSGLTVLAHHLPGQHAATVLCHLGIPASAEPGGRDGIAAVMAASLGTAAGGITARQFGQQAAAVGITWNTSAGWTGPVITLQLPARNIPAALGLLRLALAEPALRPADAGSQIRLAAARLAAAAASPRTRARQELPAAVYGSQCRAGRPAEGTRATIAQLTPDAITAFYDAQVRPARTTIVIAGDLTGLDAITLAGQAFATWADHRPASSDSAQPGPLPARPPSAVVIDQPGAVQTQLLLAAPVPGRGQPGWDALHTAAHILGAPATGHLDTQLRQQAGTSYGLRASLTELVPGTGLLLIAGAVDGPATGAALTAITRILTAPCHHGFSPAEHTTARQAITRTAPLTCETPAEIAATTASLAACGLPAGYPSLLLDDITALTTTTLNRAYHTHLSHNQPAIIAVGDAATLTAPLRELTAPSRTRQLTAAPRASAAGPGHRHQPRETGAAADDSKKDTRTEVL